MQEYMQNSATDSIYNTGISKYVKWTKSPYTPLTEKPKQQQFTIQRAY